jgi:crotonobetainyl-CoA:carnitine CoA-transferase CaiB-like acyl-CoA transferase
MDALGGLKVVDLSPTRVGAQVSQVLADHGADVVWVEPPGGAQVRSQAAFPFLCRGKRSVVLDLHDEADVERVRQLADAADVLIETFRPGVAERLGLGADELQGRNPQLIHTSITGWGRRGPYADAPGYEHLVMAKLGVFHEFLGMHDDRRPPFVAVPWCSYPASQLALHGILAALVERERSGLGQKVDANLVQGFASLDTWNWFVRLVNERWPDAYPGAEPFDSDGVPLSPLLFMLTIGLTADGRWLQFAQVGLELFLAFLRALGLEWMLTDPKWQGLPLFEDKERRLELWTTMLEAIRSKSLAEWEQVFDADPDVYAELFRSGPEVLDHPQLVHDGEVVTVVDPARGAVRQPGPMLHMSATPAVVERPAPTLGSCTVDDVAWTAPEAVPVDAEPGGLPLEGVTVVELAVMYAAPFGATLLTDLGARVIKVEALTGDPIRSLLGFPEAAGVKVMQGKESVCVDITTPEGLAIVHKLAERADIVLEGFRAGVADRLGLGAAALRERNPDLVYLSSPGYGDGPPNGHRPAYAPSIGAAGGIVRANLGELVPERDDLDVAQVRNAARRMSAAGTRTHAQADGFAAVGVATNLLLGLAARARGAGGQRLTGSMLVTVAHAMADHVVDHAGAVHPKAPDGELRGTGARYRVYDAADGWVFLAAPQEREWPRLVAALATHVDLAADERFTTEALRRENDEALAEALTEVFASRGKDVWEGELLSAGVGCVAVSTQPVESVLLSDDFGHANGFVVDVEHPTFDHHPRLAPLVHFSRSVTQAKPGVLAGSATDAVLTELGYTSAEIDELRARKIIG